MPRSMMTSKGSEPVMADPPSSTRHMSVTPSSVASRRTRMFSAGSRFQTRSSRPEAIQNRDSRRVGSSPISRRPTPARHDRLFSSIWAVRGVLGRSVTVAVSLVAGLLGPVAIAGCAVLLNVPVWIAWWWLVRRG